MLSGSNKSLSFRLMPLALIALVASCPYAISVPWNALYLHLTGNSGSMQIMASPIETQSWYIVFATPVLLMGLPWAIYKRGRLGLTSGLVIAYFCWIFGRFLFVSAPREINAALLIQGSFCIVYLIIQGIALPSGYLARACYFLVFASIPMSIIAILQKSGFDPLPYSNYFAFTDEAVKGKFLVASTFGHPNYMGSYLAPVILLGLALFPQSERKSVRALLGVTIALGVFALLAGGARSALLSLVVGLGVFLLATGIRPTRRGVLVYGIPMVIGALLAILFFYGFEQFGARFLSTREIISRVFYWQVGFAMAEAHPLVGVGLHQFDAQFWETVKTFPPAQDGGEWHFALSQVVRGVRPGHLHNDHLQALVENGAIGALLWASLWITTFRAAGKRSDLGSVHPLATVLPGVFTVILIDASFGFPFQLPCSGLLSWYLLALWHRELKR